MAKDSIARVALTKGVEGVLHQSQAPKQAMILAAAIKTLADIDEQSILKDYFTRVNVWTFGENQEEIKEAVLDACSELNKRFGMTYAKWKYSKILETVQKVDIPIFDEFALQEQENYHYMLRIMEQIQHQKVEGQYGYLN
ncbi:MAG: hypothetical protein EZS28_033016 [Streblomastix strix]|uniref:Uncharacterized protein n=1 Tax=Streblomastix strix TaxID=222440 RepID=A0A5J4UM02_9EUKA|nr:MAG: hypothetical protein EZS28_033016 [Streblomastix strix]